SHERPMILSDAARVVLGFDFRVRFGIAAAFPMERATKQLLASIRSLILGFAQSFLIQATKKCELFGAGITICNEVLSILKLASFDQSLRFDCSRGEVGFSCRCGSTVRIGHFREGVGDLI